MAQDHKLAEMKNMDDGVRGKLAEMGVSTIEEMLMQFKERGNRDKLAETLGVPKSQITEWLNRADLMRLKGVGYEMANLLEECGVDSCKELQRRVAANLQSKLKETNDAKKITHHAPSLTQVEGWIAEAKTLSA